MADEKVAKIIVESIRAAGVKYVFGVPGAKIDAVFNTLLDHPEITCIVCRHEQNAAFMAAALGRITGIPGVCMATSGPGASNLVTGLMTATTEGDPVVALVGSVPRNMSTKHTHQSAKTLEMLGPASKTAVGIEVEDQAAEVVLGAFRTASAIPRGAAVVSLPSDVAAGSSSVTAFAPSAFTAPLYGPAPHELTARAAALISSAKLPVLFLGQRASSPPVVGAIRAFLAKHPLPVVETFQAAGAVSKDLAQSLFYGRVGIFRNQVGDRLLAKSDLVVALGYDPSEYDAEQWNPEGRSNVIHVDTAACDFGKSYCPQLELLGSVKENVLALAAAVTKTADTAADPFCSALRTELSSWRASLASAGSGALVQPLHFISLLQSQLPDDTTVTCDVGTVYIHMMRYFLSFTPRTLLCSNGQQTLGIGMPWAIAASLAQNPPCSRKVVSLSGDGGFMFSAQELSTAIQQRCNITHFVWDDEAYNMVEFQEEMKYGRSSGVRLGDVDFVKLAEAFGGRGFRMVGGDVESVMKEALAHEGLSLVDVQIDYSRVKELAGDLIKDSVD